MATKSAAFRPLNLESYELRIPPALRLGVLIQFAIQMRRLVMAPVNVSPLSTNGFLQNGSKRIEQWKRFNAPTHRKCLASPVNQNGPLGSQIIARIVKAPVDRWRTRKLDVNGPDAVSSEFKDQVGLGTRSSAVEPAPRQRQQSALRSQIPPTLPDDAVATKIGHISKTKYRMEQTWIANISAV